MSKTINKSENMFIAVMLANKTRKTKLGDKIYNYLRGNEDFINNRILINDAGEQAIQVFYDEGVDIGVITDIHDIVMDFISWAYAQLFSLLKHTI